jgi:predicted metalloprotease with PDZ domain
VGHVDLAEFFTRYVAGTEEIPWNDFLRTVGLRVEQETTTLADTGFSASRNFDGPLSVASIAAGSEAERAGLQVDDTILEVQGKPASQSQDELSQLAPGEMLTLKIRTRRGVEREIKWKVGSRAQVSYEIVNLENVTAAQRARRTAWLKGEAQADAGSSKSGLNESGSDK